MYSNSFRQCIVSVGLFDNAMNIFIFSSRAVIITYNIIYIPTKYTLHHCNGDKDFPRSHDFPCSCINSIRLKHHPLCRCQAPLNYSQVYLLLMLLSIDRNTLVKEANQLAWPSTVFIDHSQYIHIICLPDISLFPTKTRCVSSVVSA